MEDGSSHRESRSREAGRSTVPGPGGWCGRVVAGGRQRRQVASALVSGPSLPALARCRLPGAQPREGRSGGRDQEAAAAAVGGWGVGQLQLGRENCVSVGEPRASRWGRRDVLCLGIRVGWARDRKTKKNWAEPRAMARVARGVHPPLSIRGHAVSSLGLLFGLMIMEIPIDDIPIKSFCS